MNIKNILITTTFILTASFSILAMERLPDTKRMEEIYWDSQSKEFRKNTSKTLWVNKNYGVKTILFQTSYETENGGDGTVEVSGEHLTDYIDIVELPQSDFRSKFLITVKNAKRELYKEMLKIVNTTPKKHTLPDIYVVVYFQDSTIKPLQISMPFRPGQSSNRTAQVTREKKNKNESHELKFIQIIPEEMEAKLVNEKLMLILMGRFPKNCTVKFGSKKLKIKERRACDADKTLDGLLSCEGVPTFSEVIGLPLGDVKDLHKPLKVPVRVIGEKDGKEVILNEIWFSYTKAMENK